VAKIGTQYNYLTKIEMDSLPIELLLHVIEYLKDEELVTAGLVCTTWNSLGILFSLCLCCFVC